MWTKMGQDWLLIIEAAPPPPPPPGPQIAKDVDDFTY